MKRTLFIMGMVFPLVAITIMISGCGMPGGCMGGGGHGQHESPEKPSSEKSAVKTYSCPMHPQVTSDKPGKCTICGMALLEEKNNAQEHKH